MKKIFKTFEAEMRQIAEPEKDCWISLVKPTEKELAEVAEQYCIEPDDLRAALDEEERSRIELEDNYTLILVDIPAVEKSKGKDIYTTEPLGIILAKDAIITVCLDKIEQKLHGSTENRELIELLELEKSLVYFTTSLRSNEVVLEKLLKSDRVKKYPEDEDLLEDVIVENRQAIEMANIYSGILSGMMDAFASVISNNLNIMMKFLAVMTIVLSVPTIIFAAYGMNVAPQGMPFANSPYGFLIIVLLSFVVSIAVAVYFSKKKMF